MGAGSIHVFIFVAIFSVVGASLRWLVQSSFAAASFPWGTMLVNTLGGIAIGVIFSFKSQINPVLFFAVTMGGLGSLTTFSTYSMESLHLIQSGRMIAAAGNVLANNVLAIGACYLAMVLVNRLN